MPAAPADVAAEDGSTPGVPGRASRVEGLFPVAVRAYAFAGRGDEQTLEPAEASAVSTARVGRRREFAAGRACAHAALAAWEITSEPLLPGPDRAPRWPPGVRGSISHTRGYAVAVVADPVLHRALPAQTAPAAPRPGPGIGIDAERAGRVTPELHRRLFTPPEQAWLTSLPPERQAAAFAAAFAAKEAFYKAQHPFTSSWVGFHDVAVQPSSSSDLLLTPASGLAALAGWCWPVAARYLLDGDLVVVGVTAWPTPPAVRTCLRRGGRPYRCPPRRTGGGWSG